MITTQTEDQFFYQFFTKAFKVVERTARHGLAESSQSNVNKEKWLLIWSCDVAGELGEVWEKIGYCDFDDPAILVEVGDIIWGISAIALLLEIEPIKMIPKEYIHLDSLAECVKQSLQLLEISKKIARDGLEARPIEPQKMLVHLISISYYLHQNFDVNKALELVDAKLLARYPNGYSAEQSVNRTI